MHSICEIFIHRTRKVHRLPRPGNLVLLLTWCVLCHWGCSGNAGELAVFDGIEFVWIPPGEFEMGTNVAPGSLAAMYGADEWSFDWEKPSHSVVIPGGFWLGRFEVTQKQWQSLMGDNPSASKGENLPVTNVSWAEIDAFVQGLNESADGLGTFRLPTEAEWEYACRAGTATEFSFGDAVTQIDDHAWYLGNGHQQIQPVGQKQPNSWGLHDMAGNAWESCADFYGNLGDGFIAERGGSSFDAGHSCPKQRSET